MIAEVEKLHAQGVSWQRLDDLGLEYRYVSRFLRNFLTKEQMVDELSRAIYQYAKRQITWFQKSKDVVWVRNEREIRQRLRAFLK